jgi:hypothetical protein
MQMAAPPAAGRGGAGGGGGGGARAAAVHLPAEAADGGAGPHYTPTSFSRTTLMYATRRNVALPPVANRNTAPLLIAAVRTARRRGCGRRSRRRATRPGRRRRRSGARRRCAGWITSSKWCVLLPAADLTCRPRPFRPPFSVGQLDTFVQRQGAVMAWKPDVKLCPSRLWLSLSVSPLLSSPLSSLCLCRSPLSALGGRAR